MSAIRMMKKMELNTPVKGIGGVVLDAAVGFGASYGLGHVYHSYGDKWYGKQAPRIMAAVGKAGAATLSAMSGGHQTWIGNLLNSIGQAGVNAMGLEMGLRHARTKSGKQAILIDKTASLPQGATPASIGALGTAAPGKGLTWDQIQELAQGH